MEKDNATLEYFMEILDQGLCVLSGDKLSEKHECVEYCLKDKEKPQEETGTIKPCDCRGCSAWKSRIKYAEPLIGSKPEIMFILPFPEGNSILLPDSMDYFDKWCKSINLDKERCILTTLIRCQSSIFNPSFATACKSFLKDDMEMYKPKALVLLGRDVAGFMLRRNLPMDSIRGRSYKINKIPTFVTYTPGELVANRSLRAPIWEDLKLIKSAIEAL